MNLKRYISLLLAVMLFIGMIPYAQAAEVTTPEETVESTEPSMDSTPPTEPTDPPADVVLDDNDIAAYASTQKSILLFDYTDNGDYTTRLGSQVSCTYRLNGDGATKTAYVKNLGWHFARYNNTPYPDDPLYCIEPWRNYGASTSGNSVDRDITLDGSGNTTGSNVWYAMPLERREAIGLILLYSNEQWDHSVSVTTTKKDNNPNVPLRIATQFLIYEIVCGLRDSTTFVRNSANECGTSGDVFYNAGVASVSGFASHYNALVSAIQDAKKIPSFTSASSAAAPTISLTGDETTVYDSNEVLSKFTFPDGNGAEFVRAGYTLYIYKTGNISESTVFKATRYLPSAENTTFNLWYLSGGSYQTTISLYNASSSNVNAYFKLKAPAQGNLSLTKTTEDGKNLSGWRFGIYSNSACTNLVSGPHTTNSSGKISVTGLTAGTYYVKELGHTDSGINALYTCASTNPQKVTITSGGTASVSFQNKLNTGNLALVKTTDDSKNLAGWRFCVYSDAACEKLVSGPHITDTGGKISISDMTPGAYYVKELGHTDAAIQSQYTCQSENPQKVTISSGSTASVTFQNIRTAGYGRIRKQTNTGENLGGWKFALYTDEALTAPVEGSPFETNAEGVVDIRLAPGDYWCKEVSDAEDYPWWGLDGEVKKLTVTAGETATVTFTNTHYGQAKILKSMPDGGSAAGWVFDVYRVEEGTHVGTFTTGKDGAILTGNILPGEYRIVERLPEDSPYICEGGTEKVILVQPGKTAEVTFVNRLKPGEILLTKVDPRGNPLAGAEFLLEWSEDSSLWWPVTYTASLDVAEGTCTSEGLTDGKLTTGEDGILRFTGLHPHRLYRLTETKAPAGFQLPTEPVFSGSLQNGSTYFVQLTVTNSHTYELPMTGSIGSTIQTTLQIFGAVLLLGVLVYVAQKRRK